MPRFKAFASILTGGFVAAWFVMVVAWFPMARVETQALRQPNEAIGEYTVPLEVKGVIRYVTPAQNWEDHWASFAFAGGWAVGMACGLALFWTKRRGNRAD